MKKTSEILFLVAKIVSIVFAAVFCFLGILLIVAGIIPTLRDYFAQIVLHYVDVEGLTEEQIRILYTTSLVSSGVALLFVSAFDIVNICMINRAQKDPNMTNFILNIVFGLFAEVYLNVAAAILGIIYIKRDERRARRAASKEKEIKETVVEAE